MNKKAYLLLLVPILFIVFLFVKDKDFSFSTKPKPNLLVVQMEAFQDFVLKRDINGKEITPNLNKLIKESAYFSNMYQQNGVGSTSDAEFMFNTSLYPLKPPLAASTGASQQEFKSLPRLLEDKGYNTMTFHTNAAVFWNRKELYSALGFNEFYDKKSFEEKDVVAFGSSDDVLYKRTAELLNEQPKDKPYYAQVVSMSSHYPFRLPENLKEMTLPDMYKDTITGDYIQAANYADAALGRFIKKLKENGTWDNTVFAVYGDHRGIDVAYLDNEKEKAAMKDFLGRDYDEVDSLHIPFIIHAPNMKGQEITRVGGHLDMMPTIASILDINMKKSDAFGHNLFEDNNHVVGIRGEYAPEGTLFVDDKYYNPETKKLININTHKEEQIKDNKYEVLKKELLNEFNKSDKVIAKLPKKKETFGRELTVMQKVVLYKELDENSKTSITLPAKTTVDSFETKPGDWYQITWENKKYWIRIKNPILEGWSFLKMSGEIPLYKEPGQTGKPAMKVVSQNLFVSKEWKGEGWYRVFTWAGKDLWVKNK